MTHLDQPAAHPPTLHRERSSFRTAVHSVAGAALCLSILALPLMIAACGAQVEGDVTVQGPPDQVVVQDEYDYYPAYGVYFNPYRHAYYYQENGAWISRPGPPGVSVDVLMASPHARMDFHDSPQFHHDEVMRRYPKNWSNHRPAGGQEEHQERR
jgi:hypothetical protein